MDISAKVFLAFLLNFTICFNLSADSSSQELMNIEAIKAVVRDDVNAIKDLLGRGLDPNFELGEPGNIMRMAVRKGSTEILALLIDAGGNLDHQLETRLYFVNYVAGNDNGEMLRMVIDQGVSLDHLIHYDHFTVFTAMLRHIDLEDLEYILAHGNLDVNYLPPNGYSALYANYVKHDCGLRCLEIMLSNCADPSLPIKSGRVSFERYVFEMTDKDAIDLIDNIKCDR